MLKNIIINARKTEPAPPVYFTELWGTGQQLYPIGDDSNINRSSPVQIGTKTNWSSIESGRTSFAIDTDGSLWAWGYNDYGQIGIGTSSPSDIRSAPVQIGNDTNWEKVVNFGFYSTIAIKTDGTLWTWGYNAFGELAKNDLINRSSPVQVGTDTDWIDISSRGAIKTNGTLWTWGYNADGRIGKSELQTKFFNIGDKHYSVASNFIAVDGKRFVGYVISNDRKLWSWGSEGSFGELGLNTTFGFRSIPSQIGSSTDWNLVSATNGAASGQHALAIKTGGTLWSWGNNTGGQLGLLTTTHRSNPTQVGVDTNWTHASSGESFSMALRSDGTMWSWGNNATGRLGLSGNAFANRSSPVQIGTRSDWTQVSSGQSHTLALRSNGTIWTWGGNSVSQLGIGITFNQSSPVQIGSLNTWSKIATGYQNSYAIKSDGTLWSWGQNNQGNLGIGNTLSNSPGSPVQVGTLSNWKDVYAGMYSAMAIKTDGTLWVWGGNSSYQLGLDDQINRSSPVQVGNLSNWTTGSLGAYFSAIINSDSKLYTAGNASYIARIPYDVTDRSSPVQVGEDTDWRNFVNNQNYSVVQKTNGGVWLLRSFPHQVGGETNWKSFSSGDDKDTASVPKIGIKTDNTLWSWGGNTNGILGNNSVSQPTSPVQVGTLSNWNSLSGIVNNNVTAIKTDGTLWSWGLNSAGQLGLGDTITRSSPTQVGTLSTWVSASQYSVITHYIKRYT
jgi:alpha-tubulin suppressor-like RCC1 family protein